MSWDWGTKLEVEGTYGKHRRGGFHTYEKNKPEGGSLWSVGVPKRRGKKKRKEVSPDIMAEPCKKKGRGEKTGARP